MSRDPFTVERSVYNKVMRNLEYRHDTRLFGNDLIAQNIPVYRKKRDDLKRAVARGIDYARETDSMYKDMRKLTWCKWACKAKLLGFKDNDIKDTFTWAFTFGVSND